jgi:hypothetical protein
MGVAMVRACCSEVVTVYSKCVLSKRSAIIGGKQMLDQESIGAFFDFSKNALHDNSAKEQIRQSITLRLQQMVPDILARMENMPPFITTELGAYVDIVSEAITSYQFGLYRGAVTLVGIAAERFSSELYSRIRIQRGSEELAISQVFGDDPLQYRRIAILYAFGIISQSVRGKLDLIRQVRNSYVHLKNQIDPQEDAFKTLNAFCEILQERFDNNFTFRDGTIVTRT